MRCLDAGLSGLLDSGAAGDFGHGYHIAPPDFTSVRRIAELCIAASPYPNARIRYTGGDRGWPGDNPFIFLDTTRIRALGWQPQLGIEAGIRRTVAFLRDNPWVLDSRS